MFERLDLFELQRPLDELAHRLHLTIRQASAVRQHQDLVSGERVYVEMVVKNHLRKQLRAFEHLVAAPAQPPKFVNIGVILKIPAVL